MVLGNYFIRKIDVFSQIAMTSRILRAKLSKVFVKMSYHLKEQKVYGKKFSIMGKSFKKHLYSLGILNLYLFLCKKEKKYVRKRMHIQSFKDSVLGY